MNTARKASLLSIGIGLLILVVTSPALGRYAFAQDKTQTGDSNSGAGVSKKDLKQLSSCQSKAAKDGDLTQTELDSCYNDSFPGSQSTSNTTPQSTSNTTPQSTSNTTPQSTSNTTPQSTSNTTPQSTSNTTPQSQPNQIGDMPGSQSTSNTTPQSQPNQIGDMPGSQSTSNTTPQSTSNTTPQSTSNNTPELQPNQIGDMNSSIGKDLPIDKATIQEIIKNRFG